MTDTPLWQPSPARVAATRLTAFQRGVETTYGDPVPDYTALHRLSVEAPDRFWPALWAFADVRAQARGEIVAADFNRMPGARFFPHARLNFAENLLRAPSDELAILFWGEDRVRRSLSRRVLHDQVARLARWLRAQGIGPGDRVAAYLPNVPEAIVGMLATAAVGAIWSSCSPDFGVSGALDRLGQIEPTVLLSADGYFYNGAVHDSIEKVSGIVTGLPTVRHTVIVPYVSEGPAFDAAVARVGAACRGRQVVAYRALLEAEAAGPVSFEPLPFNHPLYILYSSGTTGVPKCILHGAGGTLVQHLKEHQLHCDIRPGDRVFYFTTCGWMMWNWLASALASDAAILLYDGSPFYPTGNVLFDFADAAGMTLFGTSAKFIAAAEKAGLSPIDSHRLDTVRTITSTGSPLAPESFDFVYQRIKRDVHLASISGGTDIVSCFVGGNPNGPVFRGEIQVPGLGMAVDVFDENGRSLRQAQGELVCTRPFPSMPLGFWNDPGNRKYHAAYFERFPGVWHHGDWAGITEHGGFVINGRSDAVLNPGGVRIGTAEIYRQVEQLNEVVESLVVGQQWEGDERIVLFVRLRDGLQLDPALEGRIRAQIRTNTTPRHVPARIVQVADIPRTRSGKIVELAVRDVIHGREVRNKDALANPESLEQFEDMPLLRA